MTKGSRLPFLVRVEKFVLDGRLSGHPMARPDFRFGSTEVSWLDDAGGLKLSLKPSGVEADR